MKESAIRDVVTPAVERCGLEVDRIDITRAGRRSVLRISLDGDGPNGRGPSLDEIADADEASIELDVDGRPRRVDLADIARAVVQIELRKGPAEEDDDTDTEEE